MFSETFDSFLISCHYKIEECTPVSKTGSRIKKLPLTLKPTIPYDLFSKETAHQLGLEFWCKIPGHIELSR